MSAAGPGIRRPLALLVTVVIALAACTGGGAGTAGAVNESEPTGADEAAAPADTAPEKANITLGLLPILDVAPVFIGLEEGIFEREGLNLETEFIQGGAAGIPAMVAGELDIVFGAHPSVFQSVADGLDLRLIAEQDRGAPGFTEIVATDPALEDNPAGLEGRRLALNTFVDIAELGARSVVEEAGGDFDNVQLREIPFPESVPAMQRGEIDAFFAVQPFNTIAKRTLDAVVVSEAYTGRTEGLPVAGYTVMGNFARNFPNTVAAFQRAIIAATDIAREDSDRVVEIVPTYTDLDAEAAAQIAHPEFVARLDRAEIERLVDLMVDFDMLQSPPDLDAILLPAP